MIITSIAPGGREIVLGLRGPGDVIGDLSALDSAPRSATAFTVGEVEATVAPGSTLTRALSDAATAMELLRVLASRLRDADRKRLKFAALDRRGRVAWRLEELSERVGETPLMESRPSCLSSRSRSRAGAARRVRRPGAGRVTHARLHRHRHSVVILDIQALRRDAYGAA